MKKSIKTTGFYFLMLLGVMFCCITACKKNDNTAETPIESLSAKASLDDYFKDLNKIAKLGFDPLSAKAVPQGYLVEGDILLTKKNLDAGFTGLSMQQGQYSTKYRVSVGAGLERKIKVYFSDASGIAKFKDAFASAIKAMNDLKLTLNFEVATVQANADMSIEFKDLGAANEAIGGTMLGQATEFVGADGNPGKLIVLSSNKDAGFADQTDAFLNAIICHEIGHAIGLRHTNYKNRLYSQLKSSGYDTSTANLNQLLTNLTQGLINKVGKEKGFGENLWDRLSPAQKQAYINEIKASVLVNEGENPGIANADAKHIYGTPVSPTFSGNETTDPLSLMLSHAGPYMNFTWSLYDNIALFGLYGNAKQIELIKASLDQYGNIKVNKTLQQIVDEVKALKKK